MDPNRTHPRQASERNRQLLSDYTGSTDATTRLACRNALVANNLPLVFMVAGRMSRASQLSFDDLAQVGSLGLIKAVEAFDPRRSFQLSSFAVPFIRGAIQHELRDRQLMLRIPRAVWELRQQAAQLQAQRRREGLLPLVPEALALRLHCRPDQLQEALAVAQVAHLCSLDAPLGRGQDGEAGASLLDQLADPSGGAATAPGLEDAADPTDSADSAELLWLRAQLAQLEPPLRELLEGRLLVGCSWVELGARLGLHPRQAQRRCDATLARLREAALLWQDQRQGTQPPAPGGSTVHQAIASTAATRV
jgi:RNA polymerase sigma-B factor